MHRTILIGVDGATFTVLDPLMSGGHMPCLKQLIDNGVRAELLSTPNPLTPPAWTSMITGRSPGHHGIFDFIWAEQREHDHYFTLHNFRDIQCETIWSIVSRQNGRAGSLNFPLMSPPPDINGFIVPGLVSWKHMRRNSHPENLFAELKSIPGFNVRELAWDFDMEKNAAKGVPRDKYENWVDFHIRREKQWFEVTKYLMRKHPCDLLAILLDGVDKLQHMGWPFLDPAFFSADPSPWEIKMRELCTAYFRELDGFLGEMLELAGPDARVFLASDHGFGPSTFVIRINTWLESQGYLTWKDLEGLNEQEKASAQRLVDNHFILVDWDKTTAYARSVTSNGIYIRVAQQPGQPGVPVDQYDAFRDELIAKLWNITDPRNDQPVIKNILKKEEAFPGEHNRQAPDLTLVMQDHSFVSILNKQPIVCPRPIVEGTHYPAGIFLAHGPGIRTGVSLPQLSILDVAPALLYSLGLQIPSDLEGRFPEEAFTDNQLQQRQCAMGAPTQSPGSMTQSPDSMTQSPGSKAIGEPSAEKIDEDEQEEIFKQLRALGYIE